MPMPTRVSLPYRGHLRRGAGGRGAALGAAEHPQYYTTYYIIHTITSFIIDKLLQLIIHDICCFVLNQILDFIIHS